jgi:hypothetical protein
LHGRLPQLHLLDYYFTLPPECLIIFAGERGRGTGWNSSGDIQGCLHNQDNFQRVLYDEFQAAGYKEMSSILADQ